jgi:hypothetical protein
MPIDFKPPEPEKKGVMICLDCGHKTEASDTDIHELLSLDVVHTPCHRAEKVNRGRMVRVTDPLEEGGGAHGSSACAGGEVTHGND